MSIPKSVSFDLTTADSCNWKCCRESSIEYNDHIYINEKYQVKRLDISSPKASELVEKTHERITDYVQQHLKRSPPIVEQAIAKIKEELEIDISRKVHLIKLTELWYIKAVVTEMVRKSDQENKSDQ